jgi:hypothetical protein
MSSATDAGDGRAHFYQTGEHDSKEGHLLIRRTEQQAFDVLHRNGATREGFESE